jgi:hypothetical protein
MVLERQRSKADVGRKNMVLRGDDLPYSNVSVAQQEGVVLVEIADHDRFGACLFA